MKEYIGAIFKTIIWIGVLGFITVATLFGIIEYTKYEAKQSVMDSYLISSKKIESFKPLKLSFKPTRLEMTTEDGIYILESDNFFDTIVSLKTLYGEDFEIRTRVIEFLKSEGVINVKRGSLNYTGKGVYQSYDFDTKHTYVVNYNESDDDFELSIKDLE